MTHAPVDDWSYSLDELTLEDAALRIRGWMFHPQGTMSLASMRLVFGGGHACDVAMNVGQDSPDVETAFGAFGAQSRFGLDAPLPRSLTMADLAGGGIECTFSDGSTGRMPLTGLAYADNPLAARPLNALRVGIGITTYNRVDMLRETVAKIKQSLWLPAEIFVTDDGSSDGTAAYLAEEPDISYLVAQNRGIAWNKNRALFYLSEVRNCDVVILIEDDVQPVRSGWEVEWVLAALAYGHMNYAPPWMRQAERGSGFWHKPFESGVVSGQCSAFTREALTYVGFLDTRFGRYGHEHVEHTLRMIRAGYGGNHLKSETRDSTFMLINGGLHVMDATSSRDEDSVRENGLIYDQIWNESIHRWAWRQDDDMRAMRSEMRSVRQPR